MPQNKSELLPVGVAVATGSTSVGTLGPGRSLGIRTEQVLSIIELLHQGLAYSAITTFADATGLSLETIADSIAIPTRTLARRKVQNRFESDESERLLRLSILFEKALALFNGNVVAARQWLQSPAVALGGAAPLEMAKTEIGAREVEDLIGRLEHGVYS